MAPGGTNKHPGRFSQRGGRSCATRASRIPNFQQVEKRAPPPPYVFPRYPKSGRGYGEVPSCPRKRTPFLWKPPKPNQTKSNVHVDSSHLLPPVIPGLGVFQGGWNRARLFPSARAFPSRNPIARFSDRIGSDRRDPKDSRLEGPRGGLSGSWPCPLNKTNRCGEFPELIQVSPK